jgi:hypothetical protein
MPKDLAAKGSKQELSLRLLLQPGNAARVSLSLGPFCAGNFPYEYAWSSIQIQMLLTAIDDAFFQLCFVW